MIGLPWCNKLREALWRRLASYVKFLLCRMHRYTTRITAMPGKIYQIRQLILE